MTETGPPFNETILALVKQVIREIFMRLWFDSYSIISLTV